MNHKLEMTRNSYNDGWSNETYIIIPELRNTYFQVAVADKGREFFGGDMVDNLAAIFALPTVIDNHGGTGADIERKGRVDAELGDTLELHFHGPRWSFQRIFRVDNYGDNYNAKLVEVL